MPLAKSSNRPRRGPVSDGLSSLAEQLVSTILKPLGLVVLSRERIQEALDEAAERGRVTRTDANAIVLELLRRGRQQTDELLRGVDRARRTVIPGSAFPIAGYDDLTAAQVQRRLAGLGASELRRVHEYELRHANRKSVLAAIAKLLD